MNKRIVTETLNTHVGSDHVTRRRHARLQQHGGAVSSISEHDKTLQSTATSPCISLPIREILTVWRALEASLLARPHIVYGARRVTTADVMSVVVCRLSPVTLPGGPAGRRARGRWGGRHSTAGRYGYVPLGRHRIYSFTTNDQRVQSVTDVSLSVSYDD